MKAIVYARYGPPEVLQLKELEKPIPKDNEVLVKVYAASVNSWDWDLLRGKPYVYRLLFGLLKPKYRILGCDIAGRIETTGKNATQFKIGDDVFGDISTYWGGFAEYVCVPEKTVMLKPADMKFEEAAAIPQAAVLALQAIRDKKQIKAGDRVLINGAGGGVGTFAVQMAKLFGAEVTAVDRAEKLKMLRSLGVDYVIDYRHEDFTRNGKRYDLIIEVMGCRSIFAYKRALLPHGVFVLVGGTISTLFQVGVLGSIISMIGNRKMGILVHEANKDLSFIKELLQSAKVIPVIDKRYTLSEVPEALQYLGDGNARGKVIIVVNTN